MYASVNRKFESYNNDQIVKRRLWFTGLLLIILLVLFSAFYISKTAQAQRNDEKIKTAASIEVKNGDSLWSIASVYYTEEYDNLKDYVEEIKETNGLASDTIHTGNYIIVPYYTVASN